MKKFHLFFLACVMTVGSASAHAPLTAQQLKHYHELIDNLVKSAKQNKTLHNPAERVENAIVALPDSGYSWNWDTGSSSWGSDTAALKIYLWSHANGTLLDSVVGYFYNASMYELAYEDIYTYDANGNMLNSLELGTNGMDLVPQQEFTYTYDANNNQLSYVGHYWSGSSPYINGYFTETYDVHNNLLTDTSAYWNGSSFDIGLSVYTYDGNNNRLADTMFTLTDTGYTRTYLNTYIYDTRNNNITTYYENWTDTGYLAVTWITNTFDSNNNMIYSTNNVWDGSGFENSSRDTLTYDGSNNELSDVYQTWDGSGYDNYSEQLLAWNANKNLTLYQGINWSGTDWSIYQTNQAWLYDSDNRETMEVDRYYDSGGNINSGDSTIYFNNSVFTGIQLHSMPSTNLYPNPAKDQVVLTMDGSLEKSQVSVYNIYGELVSEQEVTGSPAILNCETLSAGLYFVRVNNSTSAWTGKFVKE